MGKDKHLKVDASDFSSPGKTSLHIDTKLAVKKLIYSISDNYKVEFLTPKLSVHVKGKSG